MWQMWKLVSRPEKELKGFRKVFLNPGETKEISLCLPLKFVLFYSVEEKDWKLESGQFKILVGSSSRDIRMENVISI